ncbi:MAG: NAD-binding protein, partial [Candidatus Thorarchaeota archaeon]
MSDNKSPVLLCTCGKQLGLSFDFLESELKKNGLATSVIVEDLVCQEEGLERIANLMAENDGRIVIAACTSQKIQPRINQYLMKKGLNGTQIQYVNVREHSAWVHSDIDEASKKSLAMIRGALARSATSVSQTLETKEITNHVSVVGGGIAGIESALSLSNLGYNVTLIEVSDELGG